MTSWWSAPNSRLHPTVNSVAPEGAPPLPAGEPNVSACTNRAVFQEISIGDFDAV